MTRSLLSGDVERMGTAEDAVGRLSGLQRGIVVVAAAAGDKGIDLRSVFRSWCWRDGSRRVMDTC